MALNFFKNLFNGTAASGFLPSSPSAGVEQVADKALSAAEKALQEKIQKEIAGAIPGAGIFALVQQLSGIAAGTGNVSDAQKDKLIAAGLATATGMPPALAEKALAELKKNPKMDASGFNTALGNAGKELGAVWKDASKWGATALAQAQHALGQAGTAIADAASSAGNAVSTWWQGIQESIAASNVGTANPSSPPAVGAPVLTGQAPSSVAIGEAAIDPPAVPILASPPVTIAQAAAQITGPAPAIDVSAMPHGPESAPYNPLPASPSAEELAYASYADSAAGLGEHHGKPPASGASVASVGGNPHYNYGDDDRDDGGEPPKATADKKTTPPPVRVAAARLPDPLMAP